MENYQTVTPKSGCGHLQEVVVRSPSIRWAAGGRLWEVPTTGLWPGKFWCFELAVAYGRWPLTRGDRRWRFHCILNLRKRFLNLSLWAPLKFVLMLERYEKISWVTIGSHYFFYYYLWMIIIFYCFNPEKIPQRIWWRSFAALEPRRGLGWVNFRKVFWDGFWGQCEKLANREFKQGRFWEMHVNRKWGLFPFNMPWRYKICIA